MKHLRKALALLLCLAVCLTLMPAAFAEEPTGDYLVWEDEPVANEAAPVITGQPASISVSAGDTVTFTVKASGTNLKYQWQVLAANTTVWLSAASTTATLKFTATTDQNSYAYRCIVSNGGGSVTSELALLSVSAGSGTVTKPSITTQPKSVSVDAGSTVTMSVKASGTGLKYQWQYSTDGGSTWTNNTCTGYNKASMSFTVSAGFNGRKYRCKVSNTAGSVTSSAATITVNGMVTKPVITVQPKNVTVDAGQKATVSVTATGAGLKYQWQYRTSSSGAWTNNTCTGYNKASMSFTVSAGFSGRQYRCMVSNSAGSVTSSAATITVNGTATKPSITTQPQSVTVNAGQPVTMSVKASGTGLKYQWQYSTDGGSTWTNNTCTGYNKASMSFTVSAGFNGRQYRCVVSNSAGSITSSAATITVVTKPSITTQPKSVTVTAGSTVTMSVKASGTGLKYQWQYSTDGGSTWTNNTSTGYNKASMSFTASAGLSGRQYHCVVSNSAGSVTSSAAALTVAAMPTITTQPKSVVAADGTKATFTIAASGTDLQYQWQYRASAYSAWTDSTASSGKTKTYTVNAHAEISGYQYRCRVYNAVGEVYSNTVTLNIQLDPPAITAATVKGTIVTLKWSAVPAASSYTVYMAKSGETPAVYKSGITATSLAISGLEKNTTYNFSVAAVSDCCNAMSSTVTVTTGDSDGVTTYRALLIGEENFDPICTRNRGDVEKMSAMLASVSGPNGGKYSIATRYNVDNSAIHSAIVSTFSGADSDDVSLFFIATHGMTDVPDGDYAGALATLTSGGPGEQSLMLKDLANWLGAVNGKVIVILESCGSGAAVFQGADLENGIAANAAQADPDAFNEAVVQAFESEDRLVLSGERTYYFDESGSDATLQFNLGDFCTSKFYVLTASRHQELSWGSESRRCNVFTEALAEGVMNTMPADTETGNGDSVVNLHELFLYIKTNATGPYVVSGVTYYQHVQEYPKNSTYKLFKKLA